MRLALLNWPSVTASSHVKSFHLHEPYLSVGPKTEGYVLSFCHFAFHFLCDLPSHLEVAQTRIGLDLGFTATDKSEVRGGEQRRDIVSWRMRLLPLPV
jgi:hypothetical protein